MSTEAGAVTAAPAAVRELMAAFLARDMADGEEIFVGTNLPVIRAAALLAHLHHGPNMRVMVAHTAHQSLPHAGDGALRGADGLARGPLGRGLLQRQRDRRVPEEPPRFRVLRGRAADRPARQLELDRAAQRHGPRISHARPGAIATTTNASHVRRFYLFVNEHSPRVFVERCDFVQHRRLGSGRRRRAPAARDCPGAGRATA
jgi:glutaconate CoA-transferase subunit B